MKIDEVTLTIFTWPGIPATRYTSGSQTAGGAGNLGLLRIHTDQGLEGNAFLGSATNPAAMDGPQPYAWKRAPRTRSPSMRRWRRARSPQLGSSLSPTASGLRIIPTFRGARKWSSNVSLYIVPCRGPAAR